MFARVTHLGSIKSFGVAAGGLRHEPKQTVTILFHPLVRDVPTGETTFLLSTRQACSRLRQLGRDFRMTALQVIGENREVLPRIPFKPA